MAEKKLKLNNIIPNHTASVNIRFETDIKDPAKIIDPGEKFSVPLTTTPQQLSILLTKVLNEKATKNAAMAKTLSTFSFLINGTYFDSPLKDHLHKPKERTTAKSLENVIIAKYFEETKLQSASKRAFKNEWISCAEVNLNNKENGGGFLITGNYEGDVRLCAFPALEESICDLDWGNGRKRSKINSICVLENHPTRFVVGDLSGRIFLAERNKKSGKTCVLKTLSIDSPINLAKWHAKTQTVCCAHSDHSIRFFNVKQNENSENLNSFEQISSNLIADAHLQKISAIDILKNGCVVSGSWDRSIKKWDIEKKEPKIYKTKDVVTSLSLHDKTELCITSHTGGRLELWDFRNNKNTPVRHFESGTWNSCVSWEGDENSFVSGGLDGILRFWDLRKEREKHKEKVMERIIGIKTKKWSDEKGEKDLVLAYGEKGIYLSLFN